MIKMSSFDVQSCISSFIQPYYETLSNISEKVQHVEQVEQIEQVGLTVTDSHIIPITQSSPIVGSNITVSNDNKECKQTITENIEQKHIDIGLSTNIENKPKVIQRQIINTIKIKLKKFTSGSNGLILMEERDTRNLYKISMLIDNKDLVSSNLLETIYLNYYKNNYRTSYFHGYFPIQSEHTEILLLDNFFAKYDCGPYINNYLEDIGVDLTIKHNYILVNKIKKHGTTISHLIETKKYNIINDNFEKIIRDLLKGLALLNRDNFLHGDLKSSNIVFNGISCKLIDFGGIKSCKIPYYQRTCTLTTRPPEDLLYEYEQKFLGLPYHNYGIQSEMWSLGLVITELIIKENPILTLYNKLMLLSSTDKSVNSSIKLELLIKNSYSDIKKINILDYLGEEDKNDLGSRLIQVIDITNKMLYKDPSLRYVSIDEVYYQYFNELLILPSKECETDLVLINNQYSELFNNFRTLFYPKILFTLEKMDLIFSILTTLNTLDKYFISKINMDDPIIINIIKEPLKYQEYLIIMFISSIIIGTSVTYTENIDLVNFISLFDTYYNSDTTYQVINIHDIIYTVSDILNILNFNVLYDELNFSYTNDITKMLQKYNDIIQKVF